MLSKLQQLCICMLIMRLYYLAILYYRHALVVFTTTSSSGGGSQLLTCTVRGATWLNCKFSVPTKSLEEGHSPLLLLPI